MGSEQTPGAGSAARLDLGGLLAAAEATAPVEAIDAVARTLQDMVAAESVSFLIADFSGQALVRLGQSHDGAATRRRGVATVAAAAMCM